MVLPAWPGFLRLPERRGKEATKYGGKERLIDARSPPRLSRLRNYLTFAFCSPTVQGGRGNGQRPRVPESCKRGKTGAGVKRQPAPFPPMALTSRLPSVENSAP